MSEPFLGQITIVGFNFAPRGWALCDGQLLPIAQNTALFSLLGTTFGGDGRTTFALPDLRSRVPLQPGSGPGLPFYTWGEKGGAEEVTLSLAQLPNHGHPVYAHNGPGDTFTPENTTWANDATQSIPTYSTTTPNQMMSSNAIGTTGGSQPHTNIQPYLAMYYCIAMQGIYPSRG